MAVFEGNDAAGKGGAIRRIATALDARAYRIVPIAAPSEDERAMPWLWRFWRQVPSHGNITILTDPGMAVCWWSGWKALPASTNGCSLRRDQRLRAPVS